MVRIKKVNREIKYICIQIMVRYLINKKGYLCLYVIPLLLKCRY